MVLDLVKMILGELPEELEFLYAFGVMFVLYIFITLFKMFIDVTKDLMRW